MNAVGKRERRQPTYLSGETVNGGEYRCRSCGESLAIPAGKVVNLPVCPRCQGQRWEPR